MVPKGFQDKRGGHLVQVEQNILLNERFSGLHTQTRAEGLLQNKNFPPSWVTEVQERAHEMPAYEVSRHEQKVRRDMDAPPDRGTKPPTVPLAMVPAARDEDEDDSGTDGGLRLVSMEHASWALARRLAKGQQLDEQQMQDAIDNCNELLAEKGGQDELLERGIKPLMNMSESRYTEIQRDAASALYSLSINADNKPKFLEAKALKSLVLLAQNPDIDIRLNVAGATYAQHT
jgi:hypothetical protein